ncbi:S9 family peptidase, partial [Nonomuraea sp. NPDC001023]
MPDIIGDLSHLPSAAALHAWSCRRPALAPDNSAVAFVSDQDGVPRVWVQPLGADLDAWPVDTGHHPVVDVSWGPTGEHLAVLVAPGGGEHTQVWTVRPHGGELRPLAVPPHGSAALVRWTGRGESVLVAETSAAGLTRAELADAVTGARQVIAVGELLWPAAVSRDHARMLLRRGPRGLRRMYAADAVPGHPPGGERDLLPGLPGSTDQGVLSPDGEVAYLVSDAGRDRAALLAVRRNAYPVVLAERPDAELDRFALSVDGRRGVLVWNEHGRSALDVVELP